MRRHLIVWVRVLLAAVAAAAVIAAWSLARHTAVQGLFVCPMHPAVRGVAPGTCAICGMALVAYSAEPRAEPTSSAETRAQILVLGADRPEVPHHDTTAVRKLRIDWPIVGKAWVVSEHEVTVRLYPDEAATLAAAERATFAPADSPDTGVRIVRSSDSPRAAGDDGREVSFVVADPRARLRPHDAGWVDFGRRSREVNALPADAVLASARGDIVWEASADGRTLTRRRVQLGRTRVGLSVIESGIDEGTRVVTMNASLIEAESRLGGGRTDGIAP